MFATILNTSRIYIVIRFIGEMIPLLSKKAYILFLLVLGILLSNTVAEGQTDPYSLKTGHPRLIMTKYDELALRFVMMEDPIAEKLSRELKKDADELLNSKVIKYKLDRRGNMLAISREYLKRIITLSLAYRIFEEDKYSDEAIDLMMYACEFPGWNPDHFLDVAEMTAALAIGYDWNYYHLNIKEKETIRNTIVEFGLKPGLEVYDHPEGKSHVWYKMNNNWNQVCAGGLILGALAVGEDFPDLKNSILYQSVKNLLPTMKLYRPDGVWYEGPAYWGYANSYLALAISSMNSALQHDFGLSDQEGLDKTADFYVHSISTNGQIFNFADANDSNPRLNSALLWYSKKYNSNDVRTYYKGLLEKHLAKSESSSYEERGRFFYMALPWFDEGEIEEYDKPKAQVFQGMVDLFILTGEDNEEGIYLAAKGGRGTLNHQQLDAGTFVVDADGERWGVDLGAENYFLPDFFKKGVGEGRWNYYRNTNKSHNTLVIGDDIQQPDGESKLIDFKSNVNQPFGIFELSACYKQAASVLRGFKLLSPEQILVRDEISFDGSSYQVRWGLMTDAQIENNGKQVILTKRGKKFYMQVFCDQEVTFEVEPAKAYHPEAKSNIGHRLVFLKIPETEDKTIAISVVMGKDLEGVNETIVQSKLSSW